MSTQPAFEEFNARLRQFIDAAAPAPGRPAEVTETEPADPGCRFEQLAHELFSLQFEHNPVYRRFCQARRVSPNTIQQWTEIPALPTAAFKDLQVSCVAPAARTHVFHSSGTTRHQPSKHFHHSESLALYETSALAWFRACVPTAVGQQLLVLTPTPEEVPHSSLAHMFGAIQRAFGGVNSTFFGRADNDGSWTLDLDKIGASLTQAMVHQVPVMILGTAFSFVHLLDWLEVEKLDFSSPPGSMALETGGYKGRARQIPKSELHKLIAQRLGVEQIACEYGMSELSSQAYAQTRGTGGSPQVSAAAGNFVFPPWARARILSPETGHEVSESQTGLLQVLDLANTYSVIGIQTEDVAIRRSSGFELVGRSISAEPRGCSLMAAA